MSEELTEANARLCERYGICMTINSFYTRHCIDHQGNPR